MEKRLAQIRKRLNVIKLAPTYLTPTYLFVLITAYALISKTKDTV